VIGEVIIRPMARKWTSVSRCPDCKKVPYSDGSGKLVCDCGTRTWWRIQDKGVRGTEADIALLARYGFNEEKDIQGDVYYVGPLGHIVHLYPDGTWHSDKAAENSNFEEYLKWVSEGLLK
jgi:hypothetical protein